jgi:nitrous oxidase accessory protein NosD
MDNGRVKGIPALRLLFALTVLICVMLIAPAAAVTLPDRVYVNASYSDETPDYGYLNFSTIQEAIDGVAEGGEVWVHNGMYNESIVIDRSMTVTTVSDLSCPDLEWPIIDAMGAHTGVEITASNVNFSGFGVENASGVGIYAHGADAIEITHNRVSVAEEIYAVTCGILVEDGTGVCIDDNQVQVIGNSEQWGVRVDGVTEACIHDNLIIAISMHDGLLVGGVESSPGIAAFALDDDEPLLNGGEETSTLAPGGVLVTRSNSVLVESNLIGAGGFCMPDEGDPHYAAVDALGLRSGNSENVTILTNDVMVIGIAANASRTVGIRANGDLALIQGNTVTSQARSATVRSIGVRLGQAEKGRVLENDIDVDVACIGNAGENEHLQGAGIVAVDSYKAQVLQNNVTYTVVAEEQTERSRTETEGIDIEGCDESRVSENIVIVDCEILKLPAGDESQVAEESPIVVLSRFTGINVEVSDEPEITRNVVHTFGSVGAYDLKTTPEDLLQGVMEELVLTGVWVQGSWEEPLVNPVISDNVVLVDASAGAVAGQGGFFMENEDLLAGNSELSARYAAVMQDRQEEPSAAACLQAYLADVDDLPAVTENAFEFEPEMNEAALVQVRTATAGIVLEDVLDPVVSYNHVPVYQNTITAVFNEPISEEEDALFASPVPAGLLGQAFSAEQIGQAAVLSLINENGSDWQSLSAADRTAITDAVLAGDADALAAYSEDGNLLAADSELAGALDRYQALLENEDSFGFLNATRLAAAVPVSMSYGLLCYAEGDTEVYGNNFTLLTDALSIVMAGGDNLATPDAAAGSAGLMTAYGISGTGDSISVVNNTVNVKTQGVYLDGATGDEIETADAAAGIAHLLLAVGVSADAEDEQILDNTVTVTQMTVAQSQAVNRVKDEMALSVAATAGVGVGIVLDPYEVLDPETYEPAPPTPDEWFAGTIQGNTVSVTNSINVASFAGMLLPSPLDGSSHAYSAAIGAAASFGIVAPEADVLDNVVNATAYQSSVAVASVEGLLIPAAQAAEIDLPGTGAANLGIAASGGILTLRSYIENNTVYTAAGSEIIVEAATEELLEDAGILAGTVVADVGIVSLSPSYIDGNSVDGEVFASVIGMVGGDRVDTGFLVLGLDLGILSRGSDATFNNIHNGYIGLPYYYEEEEYEPYAFYNWWGDASGPSGFGPGTGSPVTGTNYEPWLTQPADVVLETGKSYFGLEIGSPNIGGDGYRDGLEPGWNTLSFPLALENNTWQAVTGAGDGLDYAVACTWDAVGQRWVQVTGASKINPLDAIYIKMNDYDRLPVAISPEITSPPKKTLWAGWNLVGPAYDLENGPIGDPYLWWGEPYGTPVTRTLASVEKTPAGLTGYNIVVSPSINPESWVYIPGDGTEPDMDATCGYWVYMKNPVELVGFSSTPLPMPWWAWDL